MAAAAVTSAAPFLALLEEEDDALKVHALQQLDGLVSQFWFQISNYIPTVEALSEDDEFDSREKASLLASKVFYYLRSLDDALTHALGAGTLFDISEQSEYVKTIVARALDKYFELRQAAEAAGTAPADAVIDQRLEAIVERMLARCLADKQYEQAIGICLEGRRLDQLRDIIIGSGKPLAALHYARTASSTVVHRAVREKVIRLIVDVFQELSTSLGPGDWAVVAQCLTELDEADKVAELLMRLVDGCNGVGSDALLALQIAFDLFDDDVQGFLRRVEEKIHATRTTGTAAAGTAATPAATPATAAGGPPATPAAPMAAVAPGTIVAATPVADAPAADTPVGKTYETLLSILSGSWPVRLNLEFLYWHNATDLQILRNIKGAFNARSSMCHSALVMANAFMHAGTTVDTFLRDNLEWLKTATNWAMFGATASLGVIHRGHLGQTTELLAPYLPAEGRTVSPYSEGGALFALGLIHASHGQPVVEFISNSLSNTHNEVVQHGACLGLGLASQGSDDPLLYEKLKEILYLDSAVAGEAAGLAMGLLSIGATEASADAHGAEMLAYAHDTAHEKIIRGLAVGLALLSYGREEAADPLLEHLTTDQDPILRFGGMFAIGMAYRGTDNNGAIQKLLHFAVSDVSDDVRRAAVINLGFVLLGVPDQCPAIVSLLAQSYNPHLRYGAAMAVGIACAGSGLKSAKALVEPMLKDSVDYVRQGACIAMALIMVQQPEDDVADFRKHLETTIGDKHEDVIAKMGAIMAAGILDASGRNATVGMVAASGFYRRTSIIAMALFLQYWFWFPLSYMLALSFSTTAMIGVTQDLKLPKFSVVCQCKKGTFAYAKPVDDSSKKKVTKLPTAVLSTTKKAKERAKRKAEARAAGADLSRSLTSHTSLGSNSGLPDGGTMDVDGAPLSAEDKEAAEKAERDAAAAEAAAKEKAEKEEAARCPFDIDNPARVTPAQRQFVKFQAGSRFQPIKPGAPTGVLVLVDTTPDTPIEYVERAQNLAAAAPATQPAAAATPAAATPAVAASTPAAPAPGAAGSGAEPDAPEDMDYDE